MNALWCSSWTVKSPSDFQPAKASCPPLCPPQKFFKDIYIYIYIIKGGKGRQLLRCGLQTGCRVKRGTFSLGDPPARLSRVLPNPKSPTQLTAKTRSWLPPPTYVPASLVFLFLWSSRSRWAPVASFPAAASEATKEKARNVVEGNVSLRQSQWHINH